MMTEILVREIEGEIIDWLSAGVWVEPDVKMSMELEHGGTSIGSLGSIREVERTHQQLVWEINDDAFARYVVHCCARYHNVVSFSKYYSPVFYRGDGGLKSSTFRQGRRIGRIPKPTSHLHPASLHIPP